jgi:membrane protease YdiL (CAAX protease family)
MNFSPSELNASKGFGEKLFILLFFCISIGVLSSLVSSLFGQYFWGIDFSTYTEISEQLKNLDYVQFLKTVQFFGVFGYMILPSILFYRWQGKRLFNECGLQNEFDFKKIALSMAMILSLVPLINAMAFLNSLLSLPEALSDFEIWMLESEKENEAIINAFVHTDNWFDWTFSFFLMAALPAVGEEIIFRGTLQKLLFEKLKNQHLAIWITAILFSAVHFQFFSFLPRVVIGAGLGYLFAYTGNLRLSIAAHFANNAFALIMIKLTDLQLTSLNPDEWGSGDYMWVELLVSLALFTFLFFILKRSLKTVSSLKQ